MYGTTLGKKKNLRGLFEPVSQRSLSTRKHTRHVNSRKVSCYHYITAPANDSKPLTFPLCHQQRNPPPSKHQAKTDSQPRDHECVFLRWTTKKLFKAGPHGKLYVQHTSRRTRLLVSILPSYPVGPDFDSEPTRHMISFESPRPSKPPNSSC